MVGADSTTPPRSIASGRWYSFLAIVSKKAEYCDLIVKFTTQPTEVRLYCADAEARISPVAGTLPS